MSTLGRLLIRLSLVLVGARAVRVHVASPVEAQRTTWTREEIRA